MATTYTYTAATGGENVIIDFNPTDSMYKVSGDSGVIFNIKKDDIEKISNMINAGNIEKIFDIITMGNTATPIDTTADQKTTETADQKTTETADQKTAETADQKTTETANTNAVAPDATNAAKMVENSGLSSNDNMINAEVVNDIAIIAELYNKIIAIINNAIGLPPTDADNYVFKINTYKDTLAKYNKWNGEQGTIILNIKDNDVDNLSTNAINTTISDSVANSIGDEKNILNYFVIKSQFHGGYAISRGGGAAFSAQKPETDVVDESKDVRIAKLRKLIDNNSALIDKINYEVVELTDRLGEARYLKSSSKRSYDGRINALTKQINDANAAITKLLGPVPAAAAFAQLATVPAPAAASAQVPAVPAAAAASAQLATVPAYVPAPASAQVPSVPAAAAASAQLATVPASVPAPASIAASAQLASVPAPASVAASAQVPAVPASAASASSAVVAPASASVPAAPASSAVVAPASVPAAAVLATVPAAAVLAATNPPAVAPATDPYSNLIVAFTENIALHTELAKLDSLSTDYISIIIGGTTYQIKFKDTNTLTEPDKMYYIQLFKKQIFITVKTSLLESLHKVQSPLFEYDVCTDDTKTVDATNQSTIIKDTLCKVINPILKSLLNYNNKLQNVVNNQANYAVQEQYYKNTNNLIETLRSQRNYISGNTDANKHIDKLKEQRKKLEYVLYKHYETLYTKLGDLDKTEAAIKNAERLQVNDSDTKALTDTIKTWYRKIKADYSKYRKEFYDNYKKYGSWKQTFTPGRFRGGENKTRRTKTNSKKKTRKI